jgi:hypothetical protein
MAKEIAEYYFKWQKLHRNRLSCVKLRLAKIPREAQKRKAAELLNKSNVRKLYHFPEVFYVALAGN